MIKLLYPSKYALMSSVADDQPIILKAQDVSKSTEERKKESKWVRDPRESRCDGVPTVPAFMW